MLTIRTTLVDIRSHASGDVLSTKMALSGKKHLDVLLGGVQDYHKQYT